VSEIELRSSRFRREREDEWRRLERILAKAERGSLRALTDEELHDLPVLYRSALSSLSVARATSLDQALAEYLEALATRAYFFVYGVRTSFRERAARFFRSDWPAAARGLWLETLVAFALLLLGVAVAYGLVASDPDWFYAFVPAELAGGRDPTASAAALRETLYGDGGDASGAFASYLFTHNTQVALLAFALGFAFGVPSAVLMLGNGCSLGAMLALFVQAGLGGEFVGWLMIHGVTELLAVAIAGGAGLRIGWALAFPGERTRLEAARHAGRTAAMAMVGVVVMLSVAGVLEGVGRQAITADAARYAIAAATAVLWGVYLYAPRRRA
jgi:uncharacterized membrane protein SpoIIM required for sporulation